MDGLQSASVDSRHYVSTLILDYYVDYYFVRSLDYNVLLSLRWITRLFVRRG